MKVTSLIHSLKVLFQYNVEFEIEDNLNKYEIERIEELLLDLKQDINNKLDKLGDIKAKHIVDNLE